MAFITGDPNLGGVGSIVGGGLGSFFGPIGTAIGGFAGNALGGLFGGSSGPSKSDQAMDIIRAQQEQQAAQDNLAGSGDKSTIPQPTAIPTVAERLGKQVGELGNKFAGDFIERLSSNYIDSKMTSMFAPKPVNPAIRGIQDRAYTNARFPELNPWEIAGGGAASGGQGGRAPAQIQQQTARESSVRGARSQQRVAGITTAPKIAEVAIKMEKAPHEIGEIGAHTEALDAQTLETKVRTKWLPTLSQNKTALDVSGAQKNNMESARLLQASELIRKQIANEIQKIDLTKANKVQQQAYANILRPIKSSEDLANLLLVLATAGLFTNISRGFGSVLGPKKLSRAKNIIPSAKTSAHIPNSISGASQRVWRKSFR